MLVRNAINGVQSEIPNEIWEKVKDEKHVKNTLYPVKKAEVPPEVKELQEKKESKVPSKKDTEQA